ncbi:hypothetical protein DL89DRAFT_267900, partial [Linderina pennispora]
MGTPTLYFWFLQDAGCAQSDTPASTRASRTQGSVTYARRDADWQPPACQIHQPLNATSIVVAAATPASRAT